MPSQLYVKIAILLSVGELAFRPKLQQALRLVLAAGAKYAVEAPSLTQMSSDLEHIKTIYSCNDIGARFDGMIGKECALRPRRDDAAA
ncbi:hypothetical protein B5K06_24855 [Rhizobium grahamii]|uniref:Uncharacterized protein n=1 Tax=Rhizobium grahamii TaxID=1120045 RepID=A0A370KII3_9HYPH|nr:hypothetical protein B5K06_24855 [Rhizobium grahamii]